MQQLDSRSEYLFKYLIIQQETTPKHIVVLSLLANQCRQMRKKHELKPFSSETYKKQKYLRVVKRSTCQFLQNLLEPACDSYYPYFNIPFLAFFFHYYFNLKYLSMTFVDKHLITAEINVHQMSQQYWPFNNNYKNSLETIVVLSKSKHTQQQASKGTTQSVNTYK